MAEPDLVEVVERLAVVFARRKIQHALIGGLALGMRARPRATKDADFILHVPALEFPGLLDDLVAEGFQIDVMDAIRRWSVERFVDYRCGSVRIDWMQPVIPLYAYVLATAEPKPWMESTLRVATAEGLILTKLVAFRSQDQADIESLLIANRDEINLSIIRAEWSAVAEGEEERTSWLENAIVRLILKS